MVHESESPVSLPDPFHGEVLFVNEAEELNNGHFPELRSAQRHSSARALGWAQRRCLCLILPTSREGFLVLVRIFLVLTRPTALEGCDFFSTDSPNGSGGVHFFSVLTRPTTLEGCDFFSTDSSNDSGGVRFFQY